MIFCERTFTLPLIWPVLVHLTITLLNTLNKKINFKVYFWFVYNYLLHSNIMKIEGNMTYEFNFYIVPEKQKNIIKKK